jgi:hypothetical protein
MLAAADDQLRNAPAQDSTVATDKMCRSHGKCKEADQA